MFLASLHCERYKAFREPVDLNLAPLTVVLGKNNAGKSVLTRLPLLLLGGLISEDPEPVQLAVKGVELGGSTLDLTYGRSPHGAFTVGGRFMDGEANESLDLRAQVQHVTSLGGRGEAEYSFVSSVDMKGSVRLKLEWERSRDYPARYIGQGPIRFEGLLPRDLEPDGLERWRERFEDFFDRLSYLGPLRTPVERDLRAGRARFVGPRGDGAPQLIAGDSQLYERVSAWYQEHMDGWTLELDHSGAVFSCVMRSGEREINLADTGQGFGQVLPVLVQQLRHRSGSAGGDKSLLDIVEHPELHLHPAAHGALADLYVDTVVENGGRVLVETHSENFLLRLRRRVAEGRISPAQVALYWVDERKDEASSTIRPIEIDRRGVLSDWPEGVFAESYEEVRALRRAARDRQAPKEG